MGSEVTALLTVRRVDIIRIDIFSGYSGSPAMQRLAVGEHGGTRCIIHQSCPILQSIQCGFARERAHHGHILQFGLFHTVLPQTPRASCERERGSGVWEWEG